MADINRANLTARFLGYLRYLMEVDPVVHNARLSGPEHVQVSSRKKGEELIAYLKTERSGRMPPLRVPVPFLVDDQTSGYNGVKKCLYGWIEANIGTETRKARGKTSNKGTRGNPAGPNAN
jgi:hypothetical protein